jgi:hypothetical protein
MINDDMQIHMRYEGLVRSVFGNVSKYGDPWGYAAQDHFAQFVQEPPTLYAKRSLSTVVIKMIIDHQTDKVIIEELRKLEDKVWSLQNQTQSIKLIDELIAVAKKLKY